MCPVLEHTKTLYFMELIFFLHSAKMQQTKYFCVNNVFTLPSNMAVVKVQLNMNTRFSRTHCIVTAA